MGKGAETGELMASYHLKKRKQQRGQLNQSAFLIFSLFLPLEKAGTRQRTRGRWSSSSIINTQVWFLSSEILLKGSVLLDSVVARLLRRGGGFPDIEDFTHHLWISGIAELKAAQSLAFLVFEMHGCGQEWSPGNSRRQQRLRLQSYTHCPESKSH